MNIGINRPRAIEDCAVWGDDPFKVGLWWFNQVKNDHPKNPEWFVRFDEKHAAVLVGGNWHAYELVKDDQAS